MRHRILTCKNHPDLRWSCKDIAWSVDPPGYNGSRTLFFKGEPTGQGLYDDGSRLHTTSIRKDGTLVEECDCSSSDLVLAPEDELVLP